MSKIVRGNDVYLLSKFNNEKELEEEVLKNYELIFGKNTIYFLSNKRFGSNDNSLLGIPDAFLINFSETNPKLYVIENELSTHDAYKHIGLQLWKSFHIEIPKYLRKTDDPSPEKPPIQGYNFCDCLVEALNELCQEEK